ncbi:MAG: hypothetical protein FJ359_01470 [Thaumarchaeota archaeon]|nr:hypothetical protein [Nitrososphaerota archaeon]
MYYWLFVAAITVFLFSNFQDSLESNGNMSPRMQVLQGVLPSDVNCKSGFDLIFKTSNNMPLCVKPETAKRLVERGWTINLQVIEKSKTMPQSQMFEVIPAASGTALNFYVYDDDLNTSPNGVDIISTSGLIEATINGVEIRDSFDILLDFVGNLEPYLKSGVMKKEDFGSLLYYLDIANDVAAIQKYADIYNFANYKKAMNLLYTA